MSMQLDILELMDAYSDDEFYLCPAVETDIEPLKKRVWKKISSVRRVRRCVLFLAAALLLLCAACAVVVKTLSYGQLTPTVRVFLGIGDALVPPAIEYESVTELPTARYADVDRTGQGELYVSAGIVGRDEDILVLSLCVYNVTQEQYDSLTWRAAESGTDIYYAAEKTDAWCDGEGSFRVTIPAKDGQTLSMRLYAGQESEDGTSYSIERVGVFSADVSVWEEVLAHDFDPAVDLWDGDKHIGQLTRAEFNDGRLFLLIRYDGMAPEAEDMMQFMQWIERFRPSLGEMSLVFDTDDELTLYYSHGEIRDDYLVFILDIPSKLEKLRPEALRWGETLYPLEEMD